MPTRVFWLEPTDLDRISLRRYSRKSPLPCPLMAGEWSYHNVSVLFKDEVSRPEDQREWEGGSLSQVAHEDPAWPKYCGCGYVFEEDDHWQVNHDRLYRSGLDGRLYTLRDAPPGSMYNAHWYEDLAGQFTGPDGLCLVVVLPNGVPWCVDQEASNCTRTQWAKSINEQGQEVRKWTGRTHYCWIRKGRPQEGELHVDKNGDTCAAGAGSILSGSYHGFLHHNFLSD